MAKTKKEEFVEWEYEYLPDEGDAIWIREDDERSASCKASGRGGTGAIRSRTVMIRRTPWTIKQQDKV